MPPHFEDVTPPALVKLIAGAVVFLAMCGALIFLVVSLGRLVGGNIGATAINQFAIALSSVIVSATVLYLLARKPRAEREALAENSIARQFAKRKLYFQLSSLGIVALSIAAMVISVKVYRVESSIELVVVAVIFVGYWMLGRTFWRCPACGHQLSFLHRGSDTQAIKKCPNCDAQLQ